MRVDISDMVRRMNHISDRHRQELLYSAERHGGKMVEYAKKNYPWAKDRTHSARDTISHEAEWNKPNNLRLSLTSGVNYGIYLEFVKFRHKGRLSIWWPTINRHRLGILSSFGKAVRHL